jgi:hypothetical protein
MHPRCCRPVAWKRRNSASRLPAGIIPVYYTTNCNTQCSAPEDGREQSPKHVELLVVINKPLLLHLVGGLYYLRFVFMFTSHQLILSVTSQRGGPLSILRNFMWCLECIQWKWGVLFFFCWWSFPITREKENGLVRGRSSKKQKRKFVPVDAMKAYRGRRNIVPPILNLGT